MKLWKHQLKECFFAEKERWSLWYPVAFASGIALYFSLPSEPSKWVTLAVIEVLIVLAIFFRYQRNKLMLLVLPAFMALGFAVIQMKTIYLSGEQFPVPENKLYLKGRVKYVDFNSRNNQRLTLDSLKDFEGNDINGSFRISLRPQPEIIHSGQCVELVAKLMPRPQASLPGGYQFDRKSFYLGLSGGGYAESSVLPVDCRQDSGLFYSIRFAIDAMRQRIVSRIKAVLPAEEASVTAAIMAGEQGGIRSGLIQNYRNSGLAHFLSISGLHMSMIAGLMFFLVRFIAVLIPPLALRYNTKKAAAVGAMLISFVYLMISGTAIPAQRAFIMTFIVLLGVLFDRCAISMRTIAYAAFVVLLFSPEALIGASFQMSFAAVVALVAFYEKYAGKLHCFLGTQKIPLFVRLFRIAIVYIVGILVSDLVASLATLPFAIYHFNRIALYTTIANMLAGPVIGLLIMPFTLVSLLLMPLGLEGWSLQIVGKGISIVNRITEWVSALPQASYPVLSMPLWGLALIVLGGLWLCLWQSSCRRWGWLPVGIGLASIWGMANPDVLVNWNGQLVAIKNETGKMVVLPARGNRFTKDVWLNKTASSPLSNDEKENLREICKGKTENSEWLDLSCDDKQCIYKKRVTIDKSGKLYIDGKEIIPTGGGMAIYLRTRGIKIKTVRNYSGKRLWNEIK